MIVCKNKKCYHNYNEFCNAGILEISKRGKCEYFLSRAKYEKARNQKVSKSLCNKLKKEKI
jgi:hypothetical protein